MFLETALDAVPLDQSNVNKAFKTLLRRAELPAMRVHDLRHTYASLLLAQGVHPRLVMVTLGHSQISLTLDTYSHVIPALRTEVAEKMNAILLESGVPSRRVRTHELSFLLGKCGEPGRNRTFNQQIKSSCQPYRGPSRHIVWPEIMRFFHAPDASGYRRVSSLSWSTGWWRFADVLTAVARHPVATARTLRTDEHRPTLPDATRRPVD